MGAIKLIKLRFDNPKLFALTLIIAVLASSYLSYALTNNAVIHNSATISLSSITAKSGSPADIQAAVNTMAAVGGGTVYVPAGTYYWGYSTVTIPAGVNVIGSGLAGCSGHDSNWTSYTPSTILHSNLPNGSTAQPTMFSVHGSDQEPSIANRPTRISGIQFEATAPINYTMENTMGGTGINVWCVNNFRIDHCTFINFAGTAVFCDSNSGMTITPTCYGVIDHCVCTLPYKLNTPASDGNWFWGYGFYSRGNMAPSAGHSPWDNNILHYFGQYGPVSGATIMYVEDCRFSYCRHCLDGIMGGYYCARYNLFESEACGYTVGMCDLHGPLYQGGRGCEVYNNVFRAIPGPFNAGGNPIAYPWLDGNQLAFQLRGGAGLFYNNTMYNNGNTGEHAGLVYLDDEDINGPTEMQVNQTYIWGNTLIGGGNTLSVASEYTQNVNYFLRAPDQADDGFTYTPYTYPIATG